MSGSKRIFILDFDDFSPIRPGFELLKKMKEHYPNFKCTLFTIPFSLKLMTKEVEVDKFKQWGKLVGEVQDWVEIAPHGFAHTKGEWLITDKRKLDLMVRATERIFKELGIKFVKIFKFPHWLGSKEAEEVLKEHGYTLAIDRNNPVVKTDIPTYVYNWSIDEPLPDYSIVRGHGHIWETNNGLDTCFPNLLKIPTDVEFKFVSEYLWNNTNQKQ